MQVGEGYQDFTRTYLQRIGRAVLTLNQEVEEEAGEIGEYLQGLPEELSTEPCMETEEAAVKKMEDGAVLEVAATEMPSTRSRCSIVAAYPSGG
jgi:hypothetical protein